MFVAGALSLPNVRDAVLGHPLTPEQTSAAVLADHQLILADPAAHPALLPQVGAAVDGVLLRGLSDEDLAAIYYYQRSFSRHPVQITVRAATAMVAALTYVCPPQQDAPPVTLQDWAQGWEDVAARMAAEIMAFHGRKPAAEIPKSLPSMRRRATSWRAARARPGDANWDLSRDVVVKAHRREYMNFFALEEMDLQHRKFDGSMSEVMNRGAILVGEAAVLLPYDIKRDAVLLIEQFRAPAFLAGDRDPWIWEPPAGLIDPGETPQQAARREAMEEAGLEVGHMELCGSLYPSSGSSGEYVHIFCGLAVFSSIEGGGGLPGEGEDIRSKVISFHELMAGVDDCTFRDMPLVTAALWLARHRDRLRAEFG
nr:NUDIX domain-containing protein [Phaeobacter sp. HF9A]